MEKPTIICLCGSTRFIIEFDEINRKFTLQGKIVLSVGVFGHSESGGQGALTDDTKSGLDELHLRKIDLADEVFVLNVGGYIGDSTRNEIAYARKIGKPVAYLKQVADSPPKEKL